MNVVEKVSCWVDLLPCRCGVRVGWCRRRMWMLCRSVPILIECARCGSVVRDDERDVHSARLR